MTQMQKHPVTGDHRVFEALGVMAGRPDDTENSLTSLRFQLLAVRRLVAGYGITVPHARAVAQLAGLGVGGAR